MNINQLVEQNKVGLIFSVLGCLIFFVASFFGHNYIWEDNIVLSIVFSLVSMLALFFLSLFLVKFKNDPTRRGVEIREIVLLTGYILIAIGSGLFVMHFVNTEFAFKEDIKNMGLAKIETLNKMQHDYKRQTKEKIDAQKSTCETLVRRYVQNGNNDDKQELKEKYNIETGNYPLKRDRESNESAYLEGCISYWEADSINLATPLADIYSNKKNEMDGLKEIFSTYSRRKIPVALKKVDLWLESDLTTLSAHYPEFSFSLPQHSTLPQLNDLANSLTNPKARNGVAFVFLGIIHLLILGWYLFGRGQKLGGFLGEKDHY